MNRADRGLKRAEQAASYSTGCSIALIRQGTNEVPTKFDTRPNIPAKDKRGMRRAVKCDRFSPGSFFFFFATTETILKLQLIH